MRPIVVKGILLVVVSGAAVLAACAPTYYTNAKKMSREDAAVDVLDCQKAAVLKYKATRKRSKDGEESYEARVAASKSANAAWDRCIKSRGWKKNG